jgi:hypothetical protein
MGRKGIVTFFTYVALRRLGVGGGSGARPWPTSQKKSIDDKQEH